MRVNHQHFRRWAATLWIPALLLGSVSLGVFLRIQNLPLLRGRYFLGTDAYRQVRQAELILEQGKLPEIDTMRSVPVGRSNAEQCTLYPTMLAYTVRGLRLLFPDLALAKAAILYPVVGFALILPLFFLLARQLTDTATALLASVGLSVAPSFLPRTMAGFADRDALTMLLLLGALYLWAHSWSANRFRTQMSFALLAGLTTGLLGRAWAGVGYLTTILALWNLAYLLTDDFPLRRYVYLCLWSVPSLALMLSSPAFHLHFSDSFTWLALGPPLGVLLLGTVYQGVMRCAEFRVRSAEKKVKREGGQEDGPLLLPSSPPDLLNPLTCNRRSRNRFPLGWSLLAVLTFATGLLVSVAFGPGWVWGKLRVLTEHFSSPLGRTRLMQSIAEMQAPYFLDWWKGYGFFFFVAVAGAGWLFYRAFQGLGRDVWYALCGFTLLVGGVVYSRFFPHLVVNGRTLASHFLYLGASGAFVLLLGGLLLRQCFCLRLRSQSGTSSASERGTCEAPVVPGASLVETSNPRVDMGNGFDEASLLLLIWFVWGLLLTRAAGRFDFFFTPVALILGSLLLTKLSGTGWRVSKGEGGNEVFRSRRGQGVRRKGGHELLNASTPEPLTSFPPSHLLRTPHSKLRILLAGFLILALFVGFPGNPGFAAIARASVGGMAPSVTPDWQKAFEWMQANTSKNAVVAAWWDYGSWINYLGRRATVVDEEQQLYWVHLLARYLLMAQNEPEALEFLKTHGVTHLLLSHREIDNLHWISWIGSDTQDDRRCSLGILRRRDSQPKKQPSPDGIKPKGEKLRRDFYFHHSRGIPLDMPIEHKGHTYPRGSVWLTDIRIPLDAEGNLGMPRATVVSDGYRFDVTLSEVVFYGERWTFPEAETSGCVLLNAPPTRDGQREREAIRSATFLPPVACQSLLVRLFLLGEPSEVFQQVYPPTPDLMAPVRVWQIHYPPDIQTNPGYLRLDAPNPAVLTP